MATIRRYKDRWQAQIARKGIRKSATFPTKRDAQDWAAREEHLILTGQGTYGPGTFGDLLDRYEREVVPGMKSASSRRWNSLKLGNLAGDPIGAIAVKDLRTGDFADWRDRRSKSVGPATVNREMNLMSSVLTRAVDEWHLLPASPIRKVKRPRQPPPRDRLVTAEEIDKLIEAAGTDLKVVQARAIHAFRFACVTAMRCGEVCALKRDDVQGQVARLHDSKNGLPRDVPLSAAALALWEALPGDGFQLKPAQVDAAFRAVRDKAKITGLTFHDSRHKATTDMAKKLHPLALARLLGHKDLKMTLRYYNETASDIARLLD